jgi:hypothetical protein
MFGPLLAVPAAFVIAILLFLVMTLSFSLRNRRNSRQ